MIHSDGKTISTDTQEYQHTVYPCVPLAQHFNGDGEWVPCEEAVKVMRMGGQLWRATKQKGAAESGNRPVNLPR